MRTPIAVMSFNRPQFLQQTLESLKAQAGNAIDQHEVHLFQDGAINRWSRMRYAAQDDIDACVAAFRHTFPDGTVHLSPDNIGICENFCRAEEFFFVDKRVETVWFFEDDMVLSPAYFTMMEKLEGFARQNARVAYFSAYGNYYASPEEIAANHDAVMPLDHHWAFGLRRDAWTKMQPALEGYYKLVRGQDYARRDHRAISELFAASGLVPHGTSQDAAKTWACDRLGLVRFRTFAPFAKYIGTHGAHMTPALFAELGFDRSAPLELTALGIKPVGRLQVQNLLSDQRATMMKSDSEEYREFRHHLPVRELNPMRKVVENEARSAYTILLGREIGTSDLYSMRIGEITVYGLVSALLSSAEFRARKLHSCTVSSDIAAPKITMEGLRSLYALLLHRELDDQAIYHGPAGAYTAPQVTSRIISSDEYVALQLRLDSAL